jgi:glycosyltransferase involved in cell wall biosynthesis
MLSDYFVKNFDYDVSIISLNTTESEKTGFDFNEKVRIKHCGFREEEYGNRYLLNKRIRQILKEEEKAKTDFIITCHGNISDLVALNKRIFSGKLIITEHSSWEFFTKARKLAQVLCYRYADRVIVLSEAAARDYRKRGLKNVRIIPNAVREVPNFLSEGHKKRELLAIGRLEDVKGYDDLIAAIGAIKDKIDGWKIKIYGTGSKESDLKKQIEKLGVGQYVELLGATSEVLEKLHDASGCLLTSRNEAFPMVVLESLACGTPVIAYSLPIIKEINQKREAIMEVEPRGDYLALGEAIIRFVGDEKLRKELSSRSLELAKCYSLRKVASEWKKMFEELM